MKFNLVAVIGSGLMGSGIAQTVAQAGIKTINVDINQAQLQTAKENVEKI